MEEVVCDVWNLRAEYFMNVNVARTPSSPCHSIRKSLLLLYYIFIAYRQLRRCDKRTPPTTETTVLLVLLWFSVLANVPGVERRRNAVRSKESNFFQIGDFKLLINSNHRTIEMKQFIDFRRARAILHIRNAASSCSSFQLHVCSWERRTEQTVPTTMTSCFSSLNSHRKLKMIHQLNSIEHFTLFTTKPVQYISCELLVSKTPKWHNES